jgi:DNA processing protein
MDEETRCTVAFSVFPGIGPVRFKLLTQYFGSAKTAWNAPMSELRRIKLGEKLSVQFDHFRKTFDLDGYLKRLSDLKVSVLTLSNPKYPKLLSEISDAPFLLYVKGKRTDTPIRMDRTIGIVGTRKVSPYGKEVTQRLTEGLVQSGFTIVSGLAYGVDAVAHQTAIDAGGRTIAVLGCGIDIIAPPCNARLYADIVSGGGAIVSEMPLGLRPSKGLFPARNRIISGLSLGVLVTEGADDSGSLITARNAGEQGRDVFAVPGPITSANSKGPSKLIKNGAKLVESVDDILSELGFSQEKQTKQNPPYQGSCDEQKLLGILGSGRVYIDDIVGGSGLTVSAVSAILSVLEIKGIIKNFGGNVYGIIDT